MKRIVILLIVVVFTGTAAAQMHGHGMGQMGKMGFNKSDCGNRFEGKKHHANILMFADELGLNNQQIDNIKSMRLSHQEAMIDLRADLKKLQLRLRDAMHSDTPDKNGALALNADISKLKARLSEMMLSHKFEVHELLTPDQIEKLKQLKSERKLIERGQRGQGRGAHNFKGCR